MTFDPPFPRPAQSVAGEGDSDYWDVWRNAELEYGTPPLADEVAGALSRLGTTLHYNFGDHPNFVAQKAYEGPDAFVAELEALRGQFDDAIDKARELTAVMA